MNTLIIYLLLACLGSVLFVGLDLLILKPFASHKQRRQVLLFAIFMTSLSPIFGSFLPLKLPQIKFVYQEQREALEQEENNKISQWLPSLVIGTEQKGAKALNLNKHKTLIVTLCILWALLTCYYLYRIIKRLKTLGKLHQQSKYICHHHGREVRELLGEEQNAFSFLSTIYLSRAVWDSPQKAYILKHEMAHIQLGHSYDVLLSEFLLLPQCFNPFAEYLKQALKEVHEYQADELVLSDKTIPRKAYQYTLLCFAMQGDYEPVCQFFRIPYLYNNQLKKRIIMMKNERKASTKWSYVLALPITALMLWGGNSCSQDSKRSQSEQKQTVPAPSQKETKGEEVFNVVDTPCQFPGGGKALMTYLAEHIKYPEAAEKNNISGRVIVSFVVAEDGSIEQAKVVRSVNPILDEEALRVIKAMPKWTPAKHQGKAAKQRFTLPIMFRLPAE